MPPTANSFQRTIVDGIPYWKDSTGTLYYYESSTPPSQESKIRLGTIDAGLDTAWSERLTPLLSAYRISSSSRNRLPAKIST